MSHWHRYDCSASAVLIADQSPYCTTCGARFELRSLLGQSQSLPPPPIPSDEPNGILKLWWPESVPYIADWACPGISPRDGRKSTTVVHPTDSRETCASENSEDAANAYATEVSTCYREVPRRRSSLVYPAALASNEIRLLVLHGGANHEDPVHGDLEIYEITNCPEYEAVSYTWGGEEDDISLCKPVFIGDNWDVLLQTKNCDALLRFLRPPKGLRYVWVDAICINEADLTERASQVTKMKQIYEGATRCVVFLGEDLAAPFRGHYPARVHLVGLLDNKAVPRTTALDLREVFRRRYFTRVWIIQELLSSRQICIRVGDLDIWADGSSDGTESWDWNETPIPWASELSRKSFHGKDLYDVLRLTAMSTSTDPRDKIFAVLGLVDEYMLPDSLRPEYSISRVHAFIGIFAYCLLSLKRLDLLFNASGLDPATSWPSWVPSISEVRPWSEQGTPAVRRKVRVWAIETFMQCAHRMADRGIEISGTLFGQLHEVRPLSISSYDTSDEEWLQSAIQWPQQTHVIETSGALSIPLIHICKLASHPRLLRWSKVLNTGLFVVTSGSHDIYLTSHVRLDQMPESGRDHLFALADSTTSCLFFVLREAPVDRTSRLVACCFDAFISKSHPSGSFRQALEAQASLAPLEPGAVQSASNTLKLLPRVQLTDVRHTWASTLRDLCHCRSLVLRLGQMDQHHEWQLLGGLRKLFPGKSAPKPDLGPRLVQAALQDSRTGDTEFQEYYERLLSPEIEVRFGKWDTSIEWASIKIPYRQIEAWICSPGHLDTDSAGFMDIYDDWRPVEAQYWLDSAYSSLQDVMTESIRRKNMAADRFAAKKTPAGKILSKLRKLKRLGEIERMLEDLIVHEHDIEFRAEVVALRGAAESCRLYKALSRLTGIAQSLDTTELEVLKRGPLAGDEYKGDPLWPADMVEALQVQGGHYPVQIL